MTNNQSTQLSVMVHVKNKSSTRDRIDFEKKMKHDIDVIFDLEGNTRTHVMTTYTKWNI